MFEITDVCNTYLGLGLGSQGMSETKSKSCYERKKPCLKFETQSVSFEPSLTLGFPVETFGTMEDSRDVHGHASCHSDISTFSNTRVKRERDLVSEEMMEIERVSTRVLTTDDDHDDEVNGRKKLRLTKEQSALLEDSFKQNTTLNPRQKAALAKQLNLRPRQVEVWYQNRRARTKLKQTEVDCEYLKKCCEALTHENKRLQKEVQELKALKVAPQLYMHVPAATLTMCPSCERIVGGGIINTSTKTSYTVAKDSHNPF
ncbi:Homeobox-leucine zipper protein [Thalictrum thalictroides]|uniref:Homeobox-leucine zipper protein n=1 Tax=Thalictrum thalictroides TaxID=46969 RepID=A0A7J6V7H3_THATH|nr:Homeobox-leucine zipper protein [Thalictrum thalictroides]